MKNENRIADYLELVESFKWAMTHVQNVFALATRYDRERAQYEKAMELLKSL